MDTVRLAITRERGWGVGGLYEKMRRITSERKTVILMRGNIPKQKAGEINYRAVTMQKCTRQQSLLATQIALNR